MLPQKLTGWSRARAIGLVEITASRLRRRLFDGFPLEHSVCDSLEFRRVHGATYVVVTMRVTAFSDPGRTA